MNSEQINKYLNSLRDDGYVDRQIPWCESKSRGAKV